MFCPKDFYKEILNKENVFNDYEIGLINNPLKRILTEDELAKTKENKSKDKNNKNKGEITVIEKVNEVIEILNKMDIKDKLRLAICISQSELSGLIYNTKENYEKFDTILKELDKEYSTTLAKS